MTTAPRSATRPKSNAILSTPSAPSSAAPQPSASRLIRVDPTPTPLDEIRRERAALRQRLGQGPPGCGREFRELSIRHEQEGRYLTEAHWRLDVAHNELDRLGPIGRRTHRTKRREIEDRIERFAADIAGHEDKLARLDTALDAVAPEVLTRASWEKENRLDLDRLATLDRHIDLTQRLERVAERGLDRGLERGLSIEL